jgi:RNA polymerase sigma-70 factor (ECF subfamily)
VTEASDDELVAKTASGDKIAFTQLVARHRRRLLALVARMLGDRAAAEDIVQDVFTRAWTNAATWRSQDGERASYASWLSRVAVNRAIDQTRRKRPQPLDGLPEPPDPTAAPDVVMIERERAFRVREAIAGLPERQRLALGLTYDAELSNAEGAAAMQTSVGAFELLLVRARKSLRLALTDE